MRDAAASTGRLMDTPVIQIHAIKDYSAGRKDRPPIRAVKLDETPERAARAFFQPSSDQSAAAEAGSEFVNARNDLSEGWLLRA